MKSPYEELNIRKDASPTEIKRKFREMAKSLHPDHGGTTDKFDKVRKASNLLQDPVRRLHYDETGEVLEPSNAKSAHTRARNDLLRLVLEIVKSQQCIDQKGDINFIGSLRQSIRGGNEACASQKKNVKATIEYFEKLKIRFSHDGEGPNLIKEFFESMLREETVRLLSLEEDMKNFKLMDEMIKEYSYEYPDFDIAVWTNNYGETSTG